MAAAVGIGAEGHSPSWPFSAWGVEILLGEPGVWSMSGTPTKDR